MPANFITNPQCRCHIMNRQRAMLYGAADFYTFVTKLHNVSSVLNYATWI